MITKLLISSILLLGTRAAIPQLQNYRVVWSDDFNGAQGVGVDRSQWNVQGCGDGKLNGEVQCYNNWDANNVHLSGDGQLYIIPYRERQSNGNTRWTSGRINTTGAWSCPRGKAMIFQAEIWVPDFTNGSPTRDGLWPAFWAMGDVSRTQDVKWPKSGEWDIMEVSATKSNINQGTVHYVDGNGVQKNQWGKVDYAAGQYHTWAIKVDRRNSDEYAHRIIWYRDGYEYKSVWRGSVDASAWADLATKPYFIIFNVALGSWNKWTNQPSDNTISGYENSMRIKYVGVYESV